MHVLAGYTEGKAGALAVGGDPALVAVSAGSAHARIGGVELRARDLVATQCDPHRWQRVDGSQQEYVRVLVAQVRIDRGPCPAEHRHRAGWRVRVDLPAGLGVRAVLGEVAHDLCRSAGTRRGNGEATAGGVPDDDEQRGLLAVEHWWGVPMVR